MPRTIHIAAFLQAPPGKLYDMYLNPETHTAITGAPENNNAFRLIQVEADLAVFLAFAKPLNLSGKPHAVGC